MEALTPHFPRPANEPVLDYAPGSPERAALKAKLEELYSREIEIPLRIGGKKVTTGNLGRCVCPHEHGHVLARYHKAGPEEVKAAIRAASQAWKEWSSWPWEARAAVLLRAAELLAGRYRMTLNAATMLGQSKTPNQAEIDSACELIDFWRFNPYYAQQILADQPLSPRGEWDMVEQRPLEGFIFAVTPFNFTSIAGNLPTAPALMGNTVVWKPASSAVYSAHFLMDLLEEAGMPPGVINMIPGPGSQVGPVVLGDPSLAGVHFTGSTAVFQAMWKTIGANIASYKGYPRIVGETGGKDFVFAHPSADEEALITALIRGAFEYQGQKCSAVSRAYIPDTLWKKIEAPLFDKIRSLKMGDVRDFTTFVAAVIDQAAFENIKGYIDYARTSSQEKILLGGEYDDSKGYFVQPTVVQALDPKSKLMSEEIFGPVLTVYVYPEKEYRETLEICDGTSPYGLTGAIFANDRGAVLEAMKVLRHAAGNFYINDKPTGAVVGRQPFGGSRASGTNDKAGSYLNLLRWVTPRTIKENFNPPRSYEYPYMAP